MKQLQLILKTQTRKEHGGSLLIGKRRSRRPLSLKSPLHLVLRSDFAYGHRALVRHRPLIQKIINKSKNRFQIKVYELAIVSNHIHLLVLGQDRASLQNFFRVVAGHIAQELLRICPLSLTEIRIRGGASGKMRDGENKFWQTRIYSRIVSWGREFISAKKYVIQNAMEALGLILYEPRPKSKQHVKNTS